MLKTFISKLFVSLFLVFLSVIVNVLPAFGANYNPNLQIVPIGEDRYYNCDFDGTAYGNPYGVDQALTIIFYGQTINTIVNKTVVKNSLASDGFIFPGSAMHNCLNDGYGWYPDEDTGRKIDFTDTQGLPHYRLYAANGVNMFNEAWNSYVIATTHLDYWPLYGFNEQAEDSICFLASLHAGWAVYNDLFYFQNRDWFGRWDGNQFWSCDGYVSLIRLP